MTAPAAGRSRLRAVDLLREAWMAIVRHPARSLLTALGTVLGAAAFVATLGLSSTVSAQVSEAFDLRRATEVVISADPLAAPEWFSPDARAQLASVNGVVAVGRRVDAGSWEIRAGVGLDTAAERVQLFGAEPGALEVVEPRIVQGRAFDEYHEESGTPVVLLSDTAARRLGVSRVGVGVFIGTEAYTVMGIYDEVSRRPEMLSAAVLPLNVAAPYAATTEGGQVVRDVVVETAPGAAAQVGAQAPLALLPGTPELLSVIAPPDPQTLRRQVEGDLTRLSLLLSAVSLAIGVLSIGNAAYAGVTARIPEVGLRRAVGARPRHVFVQILAETTALGAVGGVVGSVLGVLVIVSVAVANGWVPVIDPRLAVAAIVAGVVAGIVAGLLPAGVAMRIEPVAALQR